MGRLQVNSNIDLYFNNVSLLLPFDNNFQDYSKNNFSVTVNGNVQISNVQSKFGGSSAYFNGSEIYLSQETMDYLSIPNNLATRLGTGPFTIEAWVYSTKSLQANSMGTIITQAVVDEGFGNNTGWFLSVYQGNVLFTPSSGGNFITTSLSNPIINRWAHVALVGNGSSIKLYVDGILEGQYNSSVNMNLALDVRPDTPTLIGAYETGIPNQGSFRGYINDLRITKGIARYTSNFTPPSKLPLNINNKISIKKQNLTVSEGSILPPGINPNGIYLLENSFINGKPWYRRPVGQLPAAQDAMLRMIYTTQGWIIQYNLNNWLLLTSATNVSNDPWEATWPNNIRVSLGSGGKLTLTRT